MTAKAINEPHGLVKIGAIIRKIDAIVIPTGTISQTYIKSK